ncbi:hypothetical protein ACFQ22_01810 [Lentilactobacillus raoultii]|uniref:Uncharacterized protein n=1 Tax=Lentilactobacillus raoultii TaxID=1987503 RepID=A0ABW3PDN7_9LACO|nr:hypothetical protein [Lentilactobacillus raoultii]
MNTNDQSNYLDQLLAPYWQDFVAENGADDIVLNEDATNAMYLLAKGFMAAVLTANNFKPLSQLTLADLKAGIEILTKASDFDDQMADEADDFLASSLELGHLFIAWLAHKKVIQITDDEVDEVFNDQLLDEAPLLFDDEAANEDPDFEAYRYDRPELPEYQEKTAQKISDATLTITAEFLKTIGFRKIATTADDSYSKRVMVCLERITSHLYGEYRQTPANWTGEALSHVMTNYLTKDAPLFSTEYQTFDQVMKLFIDFAGEKGFLSPSLTPILKAAVDQSAPEMVALGEDSDNFSLNKETLLSLLAPATHSNDLLGEYLTEMSQKGKASDALDGETVISFEEWKRQKHQ